MQSKQLLGTTLLVAAAVAAIIVLGKFVAPNLLHASNESKPDWAREGVKLVYTCTVEPNVKARGYGVANASGVFTVEVLRVYGDAAELNMTFTVGRFSFSRVTVVDVTNPSAGCTRIGSSVVNGVRVSVYSCEKGDEILYVDEDRKLIIAFKLSLDYATYTCILDHIEEPPEP